MQVLLKGEVPSWAKPSFCGAKLQELSKEDGGVKRIPLGNTFRRLAGKLFMRKLSTIASLGHKLDNIQTRISCAIRHGSKVCVKHTLGCGSEVAEFGNHGLFYKCSAGRFPTHAEIKDIQKRAIFSAKIPAILNLVKISREDGKRPEGMSLFPWKNGILLVWHFSSVQSTAPSTIHLSKRGPRKVADEFPRHISSRTGKI